MAQRIYTRRAVATLLTSTLTTLYTVPVGKTFIVTDMVLGYNVAARAAGTFSVFSNYANGILWTGDLAAGTRGTLFWQSKYQLAEGEYLRGVSTATGGPFLSVTGYFFDVV